MTITDRFVFIAFPRTGTHFVRAALESLYRRTEPGLLARLGVTRAPRPDRFREFVQPIDHTSSAERAGTHSAHGGCSQIPGWARHLPVISSMRHPLDLLVSAYEYRGWQRRPVWDVSTLERAYPGYPELRFDQYVAMMHHYGVRDLLKGGTPGADVGHLTLRFLRFFCGEPERVVTSLTDEAIDRELFRQDLAPVRFLRTESLVADLRAFLEEVGFPPETTRFMLRLPELNRATARHRKPWRAYYSAELEAAVRHKERALFRLFPQHDR